LVDVVRLGYDREKVQKISPLTDDEISLTYRILKVAKIQDALAASRGSLLMARRNSSIPQRLKPFSCVRMLPQGAVTPIGNRREFAAKRPMSLRAPGEKVRVRRNTGQFGSMDVMTFADDILAGAKV
jgi:hypothetical protein